MQLLNPLTILHVTLASGHVLEMARIDQIDLQTARLQHLVDRNPIHPGRFHRHRRHLTLHQPVRQGLQVRREGAKGPHRLRVALGGHARPNLYGPNVQPRRRGIVPPQLWSHCAAGGPSLRSPHDLCPPSRWLLPQTWTPPCELRCSAGSGGGAPHATIFCSIRAQNQTRKRAPAAPMNRRS